jgi:hypothetical protein
VLQEKIKVDKNRVDIMKMTPQDNYLPEVSGGYITKADKVVTGEQIAWTMYTYYGAPVNYPDPDEVTTYQTNYIKSQFESLETKAKNRDASLDNGFPSVIDVPSFIDFMIINELGSNPDAGTYSTFFHKDRNGKLRAGPIWDLDLTFGNDLFFWGYDRSKPTGWRSQDGENDGSTFWLDLFYNSEFKCYLSKRWNELILPDHPLNLSSLDTYIDQIVSLTNEAVSRDYTRWNIAKNRQQQIDDIKSFLNERITWMTTNLGSFSECNDVYIPPLVITRINYNPVATIEFPDNEDLEFIEITNNGDQAVDLTGIYFRGTGLVFQFSDHSVLEPHSSVLLASNLTAFLARYGLNASGQFTRHLSNKDQNLVLADGFGNVIDSVHYYNDSPWPDADSNGYYLQLVDINLDNNVAGNWTASDDALVSSGDFFAGRNLKLYPNPVVDMMRIEADAEIKSISIFDIQGRLLETINVNSSKCEFDMRHYMKGTYVIRVITYREIYNQIIVKD